MTDTPTKTPKRTPAKRRKDSRPTITLKGEAFGPEFRALVNKAAQREGSTQSEWIADILTREAHKVLKGVSDEPRDEPQPVALVTERLEGQDKRIDDLAEQVRRLTEMQKRSLWQRVRDALGVQAPAGTAAPATN